MVKKVTNIFSLLLPYSKSIFLITLLSIAVSGLGLVVPEIISRSIDSYMNDAFKMESFLFEFGVLLFAIFVFTYLQTIVQVIVSERVAKNLRNTIIEKISQQTYASIEEMTPSRLLTNLISDIDAIKTFIGQSISAIISAIIIVFGAAILLIRIQWQLAVVVLCIIPLIWVFFYVVFSRVKILFKKSQEVIDWLNKVINESVLGASLVRVLNSKNQETDKFMAVNSEARSVGLKILHIFSVLIPVIGFVSNLGILVILVLGGYLVIGKDLSLWDFVAFNGYVGLLVFPILMLGFMSSVISRAQVSYTRIKAVLDAAERADTWKITSTLQWLIEFDNIGVQYHKKEVLRNISFTIKPNTKTAIIWPTAAGKTQILYLLTWLISPTSWKILLDHIPITDYDTLSLHRQIGFVFQDSIIFNMTLRENITFWGVSSDQDIEMAIQTAELSDFIASLPDGLDTMVSERGSSLSGGQKQRIMLARALVLNPTILLLDDFTARVDNKTEKNILAHLEANYPDITLVSVTQKISSVKEYDQVILVMEGEILAHGTHAELLTTSPEYVQIYDSQKSTNNYE